MPLLTPPTGPSVQNSQRKKAFVLIALGLLVIAGGAFALSSGLRRAEPTAPEEELQPVPVGPPRVSAHTPATDAVDVAPSAKITVVFDRPMVALTQVQGDAALAQWKSWAVTITPPLKGRWRWLSTYAAQFTPEMGLQPGTLYTVNVPAGLQTAGGELLEKDASWKFETERLRVTGSDPTDWYTLAGPTTRVTLHFNQDVNPESIAKHLRLHRVPFTSPPPSGGYGLYGALPLPPSSSSAASAEKTPSAVDVAIKSVQFGKRTENGNTVTDKRSIVAIPAAPLQSASSYVLTLTSGALGAVGDLGTAQDAAVHFSTVGPLTVVSARYEYGGIIMQFSSPLPSDATIKHITISPAIKEWETSSVSVNTWSDSTTLTIYPPSLRPSTTYTVTVDTGFHDEYGQHLQSPYTFSFTTPPVAPEVTFAGTKGEFGIFERSKTPVYAINTVNVSAVNIEFAKLSLQDFIHARQTKLNNWSYAPDLKAKDQYQSWSITPPKNVHDRWEAFSFDVQKKTGKALAPGIYAMQLRAPEYVDYNGKPIVVQQYFAITNTALTLKYSGDVALVWATDMTTGGPVQDATITFHSLRNTTPIIGKTDANGFFESPVAIADFTNQPYEWQPEFWVTAERTQAGMSAPDFAFVSSTWNGGFQPSDFSLWSDFHSASAPPFRLLQQMITDRPAYRPGDTISFKGIVRLKDWNGALQLPLRSTSMQVVIQDPSGTEVYKKTMPFTEYGGFSGTFTTAENAALGAYSFVLTLLPENAAVGKAYASTFSVLAYRKPEYKVELEAAQEDYYAGDTVDVDVAGSYYFGAPLSDAPVTWRAQLTDYFFNRFTDGWYSFSTEDSWCWWRCDRQTGLLTSGNGTLDASGHMRIRFPVSLNDKKLSQVATIEADVTDPNNQLVSNRVSVPVHKAGVYVGIRNEDYAVAPGEDARIAVVTVDPEGKAVAGQSVTLTLSSRVWNTVRKKGVDGEFTYENEFKDTFVSDQTVVTGEDGKARAEVLLPEGGQYVIQAETNDSEGRTAVSGTSLYAWSSTYVNWPHQNNDRIDVIADKPEYAVGDTAKLLVKSPFQGKGVKALVTVERENVIMRKVLDVTGNALPIEIPITEDYVPNVYASVVIVKPREGETFDEQAKDTGVPAFRVGYVQLHVETAKKTLHVEVSTDKKQYLPGEKVSASVTVTDSTGKPEQGEFTLAAVDMSVLALAGFEMPDLVANFYGEHGLGVFTSHMLTYLIERFKPGSKGGGGGGFEEQTREHFEDTAYWNPTVFTDAQGTASVSFDLPQNLTTWQLLALGSTKDGKFGGGSVDVVATKNVILRPVRPRFAVRGDKITLGAIVHNFLPVAKTFTVTLEGSGFAAARGATQTVTIDPGAMTKVTFPVVVHDVRELTLRMKAETDGAVDAIVEKIPVEIFGTPQSVATTGVTESLVTEKVLAPSEKDASSGTLDITVSPSIATYLPGGLEYLADYPYGCAEQITSTFVPQLALKKLQGFDAFKIVPDAVLEEHITGALQKLYRFQKSDGGFGYWEESWESSPYLTAYVLYGLRLAKQTSYVVDATSMSRAAEYLDRQLRAADKVLAGKPNPIDLPTRAYILFVLSETGRPDQNLLSNLYEKRQSLPVFSQAELAMALQNAGMTKKAKEILSHVLDNAKIDPRGAHVEEPNERSYRILMQTNTRTTAEALQAMVRIDPENVYIPQFIRFLLSARKDGHWDTTQSTTQTILALVDYLKASGELNADYIAGVEVNDKMVITQRFNKDNILTRKEVTLALDDLLRGEENTVKLGLDASTTLGTGSKGKLFYDVLLSYFYTGDVIPAADQGISIMRELGSIDAKGPQSLSSVKVGDTYRVTLTMTVPEDRYFVAVESPHPAGLEGIDPGLKTSKQLGAEPGLNPAVSASEPWWWDDETDNGLWRFSHREFRDDRVFLFADYLPAGVYKYTYLVRATTPGSFRERPARIFEMYFPENFGQTEGKWFTVKE